MNRIILEESEYDGDLIYRLDSRKSNHVLKILKANIGDQFKAGVLNSSLGVATVSKIDQDNRLVSIHYRAETNILPKACLFGLRVFSSIQRPQTVKKMIHLCANCGIPELFFFPAEKSEFSYLNSSIWSERNLLDEIILGLEQGGRVVAPKIQVLKNKYKIKEHLTSGNRFLLDFNSKYLTNLLQDFDFKNTVQIVLGPESGFIDEDILFFQTLGFEKITVSENILRSEVALSFFLAQFELLKSCPT